MSEFEQTSQPLYSQIIHRSRYSRFLPHENRRETWEETVDRLINYLIKKIEEQPDD